METEFDSKDNKPVREHGRTFSWKRFFLWGIPIPLFLLIILAPSGGSHVSRCELKRSHAMQQARAIYVLLDAYADAHQGVYPTGNSSTEIFQKLVDENHMRPSGKGIMEIIYEGVSDPALFCVDMPGKTPATSTTLRPENVSFDVTLPMGKDSPDKLPVVFMTGYRVSYLPNGTATPFPALEDQHLMVLCYNDGNAMVVEEGIIEPDKPSIKPDGTVSNFVPATFNPAGKKYQQLTPNGLLAP